uniref:SFRICE_040385 n=1 Tax=Spodoptera frugiperda TaxID=7108 RepID=A0A2H1WZJ2_SPOFR
MNNNTLHTVTEIDNIEIAHTVECDSTELHKYICVNKSDLTIISQNIRSIYYNFDSFLVSLSNLKFEPDIIILTECRLHANKSIPQMNNYRSYMTTRQLNQNDGVVVYVRNSLNSKVKEIQLLQASCLRLDILGNIVLCIYRSPSNSNTDSFIDSLSTQLNTLTSQRNIIIAGDININLKHRDTESSQEQKSRDNYLNMLSLFGILPGHTLPTREQSCLDHFMLKMHRGFLASIAILHTTVTDHYTTFISIKKLKNIPIINRTSTTLNYDQALRDLQERNLSDLLFCDDPNLLINNFIKMVTEVIHENTNIKNVPSNQRIIKPWITLGILRCIKNRNRLQKNHQNDPHNEILKLTYTRYRNFCNNLIKRLKRKYERNLLAQSVSNNKLLWKNVKTITHSNRLKSQNVELLNIKTTPMESINYVNSYFANIGEQLAKKIHSDLNNTLNPTIALRSQLNSFVLLDTDDSEVHGILMNLKSDSAPGWDNVSTKFLKHIREEAVPIITHLANLCFQEDDTSIVFYGPSWHKVKRSAEAGMARVAEWLKSNLLSLNTNKTNYICFSISNRTQPIEELDLKVHICGNLSSMSCDCPCIEKVAQTKYLGVVLDQALSWYPHIEQTSGRIRKLSWVFKTLRHIVPTKLESCKNRPRNLLNEIYVALAQSVLLYCIPIWGGAAKTKFIHLERAQRALIKLMYFKNKRFPTSSLYQISDLLSVRKLYILQIVLKKHKTLSYNDKEKSKRRKDLVLQVPQTKTRFAYKQFNKRSSQLYNKINKHVYIYNKSYYDCKISILDWIKLLTYEETETLLEHVE